MCLIALAWRVHPRFPLALIANRDEAHARPTAAAGFDPGAPDVYGGRDLVQGGSWLQVSTPGRLVRKSVVYGKGVSVRVDPGGCSIVNNTTQHDTYNEATYLQYIDYKLHFTQA